MKSTVKRYDTYLSLKSELTCKLHREGFPEGEDMTKSAEWLSLCVVVTAGYALTVAWNVK